MLEFIFEIFFIHVLHDAIFQMGEFIRWCLRSGFYRMMGKPTTPFRKYSRKKLSDRDPSNQMSNGLIDGVVGYGVIILLACFLVAADFD